MFGIPPLILWAVASMLVLGSLFGLGLMLAARALRPPQNPVVEAVFKALPGVNCGACGYKGCRDYAEAVARGEKVNLCIPGGRECAQALAEIMGVPLEEPVCKAVAVLHCQGDASRCGERFQYVGEPDCLAAHITFGGPKACIYGCLGFGTCARACPFGAITMNDKRLPVVDADKCTACGACVRACPRGLFTIEDRRYTIHLGCSSHDRGKAVRDVCSVGCIACRRCEKEDPHKAIKIVNDLPVLDYAKADGDFRVAAQVCPMGCFYSTAGEQLAAPAQADAQAAGPA